MVRNVADLLAVRLLGHRELPLARVVADGILPTVADREHCPGELGLCQREQEIRLVLGRIGAAPQPEGAARLVSLDPRIVAGRDRVGTEAAGPLGERGELEIAVAAGAGERRPSGRVLAHEIRYHVVVELALEIDDVVRDADRGGDTPCVGQILERAAAAERARAVTLFRHVIELHGQTDNLVALLGQERRGHRRIHAARHCNHDAHFEGPGGCGEDGEYGENGLTGETEARSQNGENI